MGAKLSRVPEVLRNKIPPLGRDTEPQPEDDLCRDPHVTPDLTDKHVGGGEVTGGAAAGHGMQ